MKKIILLATLVLITGGLFAQAIKPTLMVVPSDNWCTNNGYVQTYENQGKTIIVSDYTRALREDAKMGMAIHKIEEIMNTYGFPLKNLEQTLKSITNQAAENAMLTGQSGAAIAESPIDRLKKTAKADIILYLNWTAMEMGPKLKIVYDLAGMDAYTNNNVATVQGQSAPLAMDEISILQLTISANMKMFVEQLSTHFNDMQEKGRQVSIRIKAWDDFEDGLEAEFDGVEVSEIIENWMTDNCVQGRSHLSDATEHMMYFDEIRIPLFDENGRTTDARKWLNNLRKYLKNNYQIESKLMMQGLGQAQLVIGGK